MISTFESIFRALTDEEKICEENGWPTPGTYCQYNEYEAEVVACDGESVWIEVYFDDGEEVIEIPYVAGRWG